MILQYSKTDEKKIISEAVSVLKRGGLIVYPTDTIYGIGADITNKRAVRKIFEIKNRPFFSPLSILCANAKMASKYTKLSPLAKKKLPGKFTFILPITEDANLNTMCAIRGNVGIRIPKHWCTKISNALEKPITTTSANVSRGQDLTTIEVIRKTFKSQIDLYIDQGELLGKPSTIYSADEKKIR
jgi:tRNA threonylcarbamoyl adenosine modification protein (Sua5/YciO/YrdC/YwlC family)